MWLSLPDKQKRCLNPIEIRIQTPFVMSGGAEGIRTPDLLSAIQARSQLRHSPTRPIRDTSRFALNYTQPTPIPQQATLEFYRDNALRADFMIIAK